MYRQLQEVVLQHTSYFTSDLHFSAWTTKIQICKNTPLKKTLKNKVIENYMLEKFPLAFFPI